ncbi:MAG: DUF4834 family protein [Bacteroidota bacterium]
MKFLIIAILLYVFFRLLGHYILPWMVKRYVKKAGKDFFERNPDADPEYRNKKKKREGEINVKYGSGTAKKSGKDDNLGDYVDFEEIDEE